MKSEIVKDVNLIAKELIKGEIAAIPTETVYGLAANALNADAVLKIFKAKDRPKFNPLIIHLSSLNELEKYAVNIPEKAIMLFERFSPGPLTIVLEKKSLIPDAATAGLETAGFRIPNHKILLELLNKIDFPLAAPSANVSGGISPTNTEDTLKELNGRVRYILDGGECEKGLESTVIKIQGDEAVILRPGAITKEQISKYVTVLDNNEKVILSPGMSTSHYKPKTKLFITKDLSIFLNDKHTGILDAGKFETIDEYAATFYRELRKLDEKNYEKIVTTMVEEKGIGIAINDRLRRASSGTI